MASLRDTLADTLIEVALKDPNIVVVTADVGGSTRAFKFKQRFLDRYFNVGISEQDMINFAAGLSAVGLQPVVMAFAMFLMRAWEMIRNSISRMNLNVKIIATHAGFSDSDDGSSHQALEDIALMRVLPNFKVVVPADATDIKRSLPVIIGDVSGPVYYRIGRDYAPDVTDKLDYTFKLGKSYVIKDGEDLTIIGVGVTLWDAVKASEELKKYGINASVINLFSVKPLDEELLLKYAQKTGKFIVIEEHNVNAGAGSAISELLSTRYPIPVKIMGTTSFGRSARSQRHLLEYYGLTYTNIVKEALNLVQRVRR